MENNLASNSVKIISESMDEKIIHFLKDQTCATICCIDEEGHPYCFSCFYAFNPEINVLYFKSSVKSKHSIFLKEKPGISGTILPDKLNKLAARGIQLRGEFIEHAHLLSEDASGYYHKKFPFARAIKGEVFTICLTDIKMTDSSFGFAKKFLWTRSK